MKLVKNIAIRTLVAVLLVAHGFSPVFTAYCSIWKTEEMACCKSVVSCEARHDEKLNLVSSDDCCCPAMEQSSEMFDQVPPVKYSSTEQKNILAVISTDVSYIFSITHSTFHLRYKYLQPPRSPSDRASLLKVFLI